MDEQPRPNWQYPAIHTGWVPQSPEEMRREIQQLRKELARVTTQRDISKKTMGVADQFDEWQGGGLLMYAGDGNNRVSVISTGGHEFLLEACYI